MQNTCALLRKCKDAGAAAGSRDFIHINHIVILPSRPLQRTRTRAACTRDASIMLVLAGNFVTGLLQLGHGPG